MWIVGGEALVRHNFNASVRNSLLQMSQDPEVVASTGAAKFTRSDKKTIGYVYLRNGLVYSASVNTYVPNIMTRLVQSGHLDATAIKLIERKFGDNLTHPDISEFILDNHLVPEKIMDGINQDFFLEIFDFLISWENVNADWRQNETTDYLKINNFELQRIINLVDSRQTFILGAAEQFGVDLINLGVVTFRSLGDPGFDDETPMIFHQLFSIANGEWDIKSAATNFGLTHFRVIQAIYELWKAGYLELSYETYPINAYKLSEEEQAVKEETPTGEPATEGSVLINQENSDNEIPVYEEQDPITTGDGFIEPVIALGGEAEDESDSYYVKEVDIDSSTFSKSSTADDDYDSPLLAKLYAEENPVAESVDTPLLTEEDEAVQIAVNNDENQPLYDSMLTQEELTEPTYVTTTEASPYEDDLPPQVSNSLNALDTLLEQLSQELEIRRVKINQTKDEVNAKEREYALLGEEIAAQISELSRAQDEYDEIVNKINAIK